jgi:hypothetical protein
MFGQATFTQIIVNESRRNFLGSIKCVFTHVLENYVFIEGVY